MENQMAVSVSNVVREYKMGETIIKAVDNINFEIEKGKYTIILGSSGAGKSTMLNILGGMDTPSGGEQQRVAIARALAKNPDILLCDEPTGALDYKTGKSVLALLYDICKKSKKTVIVVTHNGALAPTADVLLRMKNGQVEHFEVNDNPIPVAELEW